MTKEELLAWSEEVGKENNVEVGLCIRPFGHRAGFDGEALVRDLSGNAGAGTFSSTFQCQEIEGAKNVVNDLIKYTLEARQKAGE